MSFGEWSPNSCHPFIYIHFPLAIAVLLLFLIAIVMTTLLKTPRLDCLLATAMGGVGFGRTTWDSTIARCVGI